MGNIKIYMFQSDTGFNKKIYEENVNMASLDLDVIELFKICDIDETKNGFYIVQSENDNGEFIFKTVKVINGLIVNVSDIRPNTLDKSVLIDAILGCKISNNTINRHNDNFVKKIIKQDENGKCIFTEDARDHLVKMNRLRLMEFYNKIKTELTN